jgi:NAD(P)-dependent dehydrogenase (short-subunit alcohol dehydrogenase family)
VDPITNRPTPIVDLLSFAGRVIIVTGSTRGIGLAIARLFAEAGGRVVISSRKPEACEAVRADFAAAGHEVLAVPAHAARSEDVGRLVAQTVSRFGRIDVVVANAATNPVFDPLTELSESSWERILATNLSGPMLLARLALPHIAASGGGAMVLVSSVNAKFGMVGSGAYGISKAALEQMARQLAVEWGGQGVRINAVAPGTIRTDMIRELAARPEFIDRIIRATPLQRLGEPADVAAAVVFLASAAARHITGQVLTIDGGQTIMRGSI